MGNIPTRRRDFAWIMGLDDRGTQLGLSSWRPLRCSENKEALYVSARPREPRVILQQCQTNKYVFFSSILLLLSLPILQQWGEQKPQLAVWGKRRKEMKSGPMSIEKAGGTCPVLAYLKERRKDACLWSTFDYHRMYAIKYPNETMSCS